MYIQAEITSGPKITHRDKTVAEKQSANSGLRVWSLTPKEYLNENIKASGQVLKVLSKESITLANKIVKTLSTDDPGLIVQILDDQSLRDALGLPFSPVDPGANIAESVEAFKNWLIGVANAVLGPAAARQHVGEGLLAWYHLSEEQAHRIIIRWSIPRWQVAIQDRMLPDFAVCLWMTGTGPARAHMFARESIFN